MIVARLSADSWLWSARLADPATGHVCNDRPLKAVRWEGSGLALVGVFELDLPAGVLLVSTRAGMSSQGAGLWGGGHVVHRLGADGSLPAIPTHVAADELDPVGAEARLHRRLAHAAGLSLDVVRMRMPEGHGLEGGTVREWGATGRS